MAVVRVSGHGERMGERIAKAKARVYIVSS